MNYILNYNQNKTVWSGSMNANVRNFSAEIAVPAQLNSVTAWIQLKFILNSGWNSEHGLWISGTPHLPEQMSRFSWNSGPAWLACVNSKTLSNNLNFFRRASLHAQTAFTVHRYVDMHNRHVKDPRRLKSKHRARTRVEGVKWWWIWVFVWAVEGGTFGRH